ncbi:MAG: PIN domain-containing protein [Actinomycetota bacterium]|nr:PIN domain-containing protein [Actinomycetota bacterium]
MKTIVVIDTNVLLSDPNALFVYAEAEIVVPQIVLSELDKIKVARNDREVRWRGREISRILFDLSNYGDLTGGIALDNNSVIRVAPYVAEGFPENLSPKTADDRILGCALQAMKQNPDARVVLLTNDLNMLLKAQTLGIEVQRHENQFKLGLWRRLKGKLGSKRLALGWVTVPLVLLAIFAGLWLYVPSPLPIPAGSPVIETSSFALKEVEYLNSLKTAPNDFHVWFQLGQLYMNWAQQLQSNAQFDSATQKLNAAVDAFKHALDRDPGNAAARTNLGNAYYYLGNIDEAISQYVQSVSYDPNYALAHFDLAYVLLNDLRDTNGAAKQFEAYLKLEPTGANSDYSRQKLQEIKASRQADAQ